MTKITPIKTGSIYLNKGKTLTRGCDVGKWIYAPSISWLVETKKDKILVDTGMCNTQRAEKFHYPGSIQIPDQKIDKALLKMGIHPDEITKIILTHLHWDHCQNIDLFKNARIYIQKKELEFASNPSSDYKRSYEQGYKEIKPPFEGQDFEILDGDFVLDEEISIFLTTGHSPGHQIVLVNTDSQKIVIAGDAILHYDNLIRDQENNFKYLPGRHKDTKETIESIEKIISLGDLILPGHDISVFDYESYPIQKIKYAIVGCGKVAKVHLYHMMERKDTQIVALVDVNLHSCENIYKSYKDLGGKNKINIYSNYEEMLSKEKLDAVFICTPHGLHEKQITQAAEKKIHILSEKPIATSLEGAKKVVETCERNNVILATMLARRLFNNTRAVGGILKKDNPLILRCDYSLKVNKSMEYYKGWRGQKSLTGGGVLMCQALHDIDRMVFLFGKPKVIHAKMGSKREIEVEDWAEVELEFPNGIKSTLTANTFSQEGWVGDTSIITERGEILLSSQYTYKWPFGENPPVDLDNVEEKYKPKYYGPHHGIIIHDFIDSIKENKEPIVSGRSTLDTLALLFEIYEKANRQ
jgi:N-acyl homoserine lactone hydrolase